MSKDLQNFLAMEEEKRPGSVIHVKEAINPNRFETIAFLQQLDQRGVEKMVLFENILTLGGQPSPFPLFYNPFVTRQFNADALGMGELKSQMDLGLEISRRELQKGRNGNRGPREGPLQGGRISRGEGRFEDPSHAHAS